MTPQLVLAIVQSMLISLALLVGKVDQSLVVTVHAKVGEERRCLFGTDAFISTMYNATRAGCDAPCRRNQTKVGPPQRGG